MKQLKLFLIIVVFLLIMPIALAAPTNISTEVYEIAGGDGDSDATIRRGNWWAQTFTTNISYNITKIMINITYLDINAQGTGLNICILNTTGGAPKSVSDAPVLACNEGNDTLHMTLTDGRHNFTIPKTELSAGVYAIMMNASGDGSHVYRLWEDQTSPTYAGGSTYYDAGSLGTAWTILTRDTPFEIWVENGSAAVEADTTPPEITYYNLTSSDNGCESWNTDKNTACSTSSVTPTVQFNTSENAWCAVAGSSNSTAFNVNYTDIGSSRNCTGAASGEGATSHLCTLTNQDELVYDTPYLFISCKDSSNNQNRTSTSGALKLSITGLEAAGRTSIGIGIQNALLSSYTNYTDLQIYARNLSNSQIRGTFDRAVKKGSKMWAFNRIGVSDSHVNMFNLTPVLYTLDMSNMTSTNITRTVETMINTTK